MKSRWKALLTNFLFFLVARVLAASAQEYQELYSFSSVPPDGGVPHAGLVEGKDGCFYGTTFWGGVWDRGAVFKISKERVLTVIASFDGTNNPSYPECPLLLADNGSIYGNGFRLTPQGILTTWPFGDSFGEWVQATDGYIYDVAAGNYDWFYGAIGRSSLDGQYSQVLHLFTQDRAAQDGIYPAGGLIQARDSNLYGTTSEGGSYGYGVVYRITTNGTYTTMCSFRYGAEAGYPYGRLLQASDGNFYGVAGNGAGTIFRMTPSGNLTTVAWFDAYSGLYPNGGMIEANDGCFYGTSPHAGSNAFGTVFRMTPDGTLTGLFSFTGNSGPYPGSNPYAGLVQGSDGNLYGTSGGLGSRGAGNVFRIIMPGPQLNSSRIDQHLVLSWRTNYTGFTLQSSDSLAPPNWTDSTNTAVAAGNYYFVTSSAASSQRFFRLKKSQ